MFILHPIFGVQAVARSSSGSVAMLCTSGFVDDVMFAHNGQAQATQKGRMLKIADRGPRVSISQYYWGDIKEDWGSPAESRGRALVGDLGDEVPQKLKLFL